jgi:hypothetical protein
LRRLSGGVEFGAVPIRLNEASGDAPGQGMSRVAARPLILRKAVPFDSIHFTMNDHSYRTGFRGDATNPHRPHRDQPLILHHLRASRSTVDD